MYIYEVAWSFNKIKIEIHVGVAFIIAVCFLIASGVCSFKSLFQYISYVFNIKI